MAGARPLFAISSLVLILGGLLLQFFTILSGAVDSAPISKFYFLEASTTGIPNARNPSRWTYFAICGKDPSSDHNANCGNVVPALPFDPPRNFGTHDGIPHQFIGTHKYYYLSRFMFAFYLVALVFAAFALISGLLAIFSRLGGYISALTTSIALFFQALASSCLTAWVIKGRHAFRSAGHDAKIGKYLLAFAWSSTAAFVLATILFCLGGKLGRDKSSSHIERSRSTRSERSRGSFAGNGNSRIKDDYS